MQHYITLACVCRNEDRVVVMERLRERGEAAMVFFCADYELVEAALSRFGEEHCRVIVWWVDEAEAEYWVHHLSRRPVRCIQWLV